jgi:signal transduction histidine kinase
MRSISESIAGATALLKEYAVSATALYYRKNNKFLLLYFDNRGGYMSCEFVKSSLKQITLSLDLLPDCQIFRQGDIFRIAEEGDQSALHDLLDSLDTNLQSQRRQVVRILDGINKNHFSDYAPAKFLDDIRPTLRRLDTYSRIIHRVQVASTYDELRRVARDVGRLLRRLTVSDALEEHDIRAWLENFLDELTFLPIQTEAERLCDEILSTEGATGPIDQHRSDLEFIILRRVRELRDTVEVLEQLDDTAALTPQMLSAIRGLCLSIRLLLDEQEALILKTNANFRKRNIGIVISIEDTSEIREYISELLSLIPCYDNGFQLLDRFAIARDYTKLHEVVESLAFIQRTARELTGYWRFGQETDNTVRRRPGFLRAIFPELVVDIKAAERPRRFSELSFGQKCGTILAIFLLNTNVRTIFLDQPEDHLDVSGVVFLLAPILEELSSEHDFVIASHSVNLVMSLPAAHVSALEVIGGRDFRQYHGSLSDRQIVDKILDIMGGGTQVFLKRLSLYSDFSERLREQIESTDALLQTAFRRRTIDELRNYIQPIVSDFDIVRTARHDLKQAFVDTGGSILAALPEKIARMRELVDDDFFSALDRVTEYLGSHIQKLQETVEQMRSLNKAPARSVVKLQAFLEEIADRCTRPKLTERQIRVRIIVDEREYDTAIFVDPQHLEIIIRNLLENSLRATEEKAIEREEAREDFEERVVLSIREASGTTVLLDVEDNGVGMRPEIARKLYRSRCTTQTGRDHGHGGLMIARLLELNGGRIEFVESLFEGANTGTHQRIRLPLALAAL